MLTGWLLYKWDDPPTVVYLGPRQASDCTMERAASIQATKASQLKLGVCWLTPSLLHIIHDWILEISWNGQESNIYLIYLPHRRCPCLVQPHSPVGKWPFRLRGCLESIEPGKAIDILRVAQPCDLKHRPAWQYPGYPIRKSSSRPARLNWIALSVGEKPNIGRPPLISSKCSTTLGDITNEQMNTNGWILCGQTTW